MKTNEYILRSDASVLDALRQLNGLPGRLMTLLVVDADGRLTGTVTDGDIRRGLLCGVAVSDRVATSPTATARYSQPMPPLRCVCR